ncbi:MAG: 4'-phosphopantetheinyl transferase superfamily protein [Deltaproteobacteria bacterium]|nr:4'-phosphopantetheinyl transferase superfamily protein [Deltaproteobacteria bacterium]
MTQENITVQVVDFSSINDDDLLRIAQRWPQGVPNQSPLSASQRQTVASRYALSLIVPQVDASLNTSQEHGFSQLTTVDHHDSVSFAHTETLAIAALCRNPVGVDVENISRTFAYALPKFATSAELLLAQGSTLIENVPVSNMALLWTAKEATSKATGLGGRKGFPNFELAELGPGPLRIRVHSPGPIPLHHPFVQFRLYSARGLRYLIAVCTEGQNNPLNLLAYPPHGIDTQRG